MLPSEDQQIPHLTTEEVKARLIEALKALYIDQAKRSGGSEAEAIARAAKQLREQGLLP